MSSTPHLQAVSPPPAQLDQDRLLLQEAIDMSSRSLTHDGFTPFGAVVAIGDKIVGRGYSSVVHDCDPTAHAEINALRDAGRSLGTHLMPQATMFCSTMPCPLCLVACWWAQVPRIVTAGTLDDSAAAGFEDTEFYHTLTLPKERFKIITLGEESLQEAAAEILRDWKRMVDGGEDQPDQPLSA